MKKEKGKLIYYILIVLIAIAIVLTVLLWFGGRKNVDIVPSPELSVQKPDVVIKEVEKFVEIEKQITAEVIQDGLKDMGVLITEEYYFTEVVSFSSVKNLFKTEIALPFTESSYLASYDGVVTAGIDFTQIEIAKDDSLGLITVTLPKAGVQNVDIDPESFILYSEKEGLGNPFSINDFNMSLIDLENKAESKAIERGLLTRADENAKSVISNFIGSITDASKYKIEFMYK